MSIVRELASYEEVIPYDLASQLGPSGIRLVLEAMWLSYHDLIKDNIISKEHDENEITQKWYSKIQSRWAEDSSIRIDYRLYPVQQYVDRSFAKPKGAKPTIDFCFHTYDYSESYFGAECKILIKGDTAKYDRYVETGLENYLSGRYGSKCSCSALVAYVIGQGLIEVIEQIRKRVDCKFISKEMHRSDLWEEPHYNSLHTRKLDGDVIDINHLFFTFCDN